MKKGIQSLMPRTITRKSYQMIRIRNNRNVVIDYLYVGKNNYDGDNISKL